MRYLKHLKWTAFIMGLLVFVIFTALAIGVPVTLDGIRKKVESAASAALGRKVGIDGHLTVEIGFRPAVELQGLRISNPPGWGASQFAKANRLRVRIRMLPLLRRQIRVQEVSAQGLDIRLESRTDGEKNWLFDIAQKTPEAPALPTDSNDRVAIELVEVDELAFEQIHVTFFDHKTKRRSEFRLDSMQGKAVADEPLYLEIKGSVQNQPYYININGDTVAELFNPTQSWHLDLSAEMAGVTMNLSGQAAKPLEGKGFKCKLKLEGDHLEGVEALIGTALPKIGAYALLGRMKTTENGYSFTELKGRFGKTILNGKADIDFSGSKPAIRCWLSVPVFDAKPWLTIPDKQSSQTAAKSDDTPLDFDALTFSLEILNRFDADADLKVGQVMHLPGDIRDVALKVDIQEGDLSAPLMGTFADVACRGRLDLKTKNGMPSFALNLTSSQTDLGKLALVLTRTEGIKGRFDAFEFGITGIGNNLPSLIKTTDIQFSFKDAALSYGNVPGGRPVGFTLRKAEFALIHDKKMAVQANGTLLGVPFSLRITGGSQTQILSDKPWPILLNATGGGARLSLEGSVLNKSDKVGADLKLKVSGKRIGDLAAWLGISPAADLAYALEGRIKSSSRRWDLTSFNTRLGDTNLSGNLGWEHAAKDPLLTANLKFKDIYADELKQIMVSEPPSKDTENGRGFTIDMPLMPQTLEFSDADIDIAANRIVLEPADIQNLSISSRIRDGWVNRSPIQATVFDIPLKGSFSLDLRAQVPEFKFNLDAVKVDVGRLLDQLDIIKGVDATVGSLGLDLKLRGQSLRGILTQSEVVARLSDGLWTIKDANTDASLSIKIEDSVVKASPGNPLVWSIRGRVKEEPVKIDITTARLSAFVDKDIRIPLDLHAEAAGVQLKFTTGVHLPIDRNQLGFDMRLSGDRLDSINSFLGIDLPPYGPYHMGGRFEVNQDGYAISDFKITVNQSRLTGGMSLTTNTSPPRLGIDLTTDTLQMNDFKVNGWSPLKKTTPASIQQDTQADEDETPMEADEVLSILSPELMRSLDADFKLKVEEVLSGQDKLGSGILNAGLAKGRFFVDPLMLEIPGGSIHIDFVFEPTGSDIILKASASIERLDYGVLARRIEPESKMGGWLSLNVDLKSRADRIDTIMDHANGNIDFAVVPKDFEADLFELWAVNLLARALPRLDAEQTSVVNCAVFRFDIKDGVMKENAIFADTTKMQVSGKANVNFKTEAVDLVMAPEAKRPEFFSLAIPIRVSGTFTDYHIRPQPGGIIGSALRFITSPILVPIQRTFRERAPADGVAACSAAMQRTQK